MSRQIPRQGFSLEEKLKTNAIEMVASNISNIDAVILLSLVQRIVASGRADIETGLARIISGNPQALKAYRQATGINAKAIVIGTTVSEFTIADPKDPGMLDIAGFDSAAPQLIANL